MTLTSSNLKSNLEFEIFSIGTAHGQVPGAGGGNAGSDLSGPADPGNPDASPGDNSTAMAPDVGDGSNSIPGQNDTLGGQNTNNPDAAAQIANPCYNATSQTAMPTQTNTTMSQTVPEFGPISILVLAVAVVSTVLVAGRTRLRFGQ